MDLYDKNDPNSKAADENYRRQQEQRAKMRQKKRNQKLALLGACLLAVILLVVCIVMIVKEITGKDKTSVLPGGDASVSVSDSGSGDTSESLEGEPEPAPIPKAADPNAWNLKIVNVNAPLSPEYKIADADLVNVSAAGHNMVAEAAAQVKLMFGDCNAVEGHQLQFLSGYRGYDYQNKKYKEAYDAFIKKGLPAEEAALETSKTWDTAGTSEHQLGLAVDFMTQTYQHKGVDFDKTPEFNWLVENAYKYGFVLRYPADKTQITGVAYKPWHFRYVGLEDAMLMNSANICLEEYVGYDSTAAPETESSEPEIVISAGNRGY